MSNLKTNDVFVSAAQFALLRGVSATYVHRLRRDGRLVSSGDGRIAVLASNALIDNSNKRGAVRPGGERCAAEDAHERRRAALRRNISTALMAVADVIVAKCDDTIASTIGRLCIEQELHRAGDKIHLLIYPHTRDIASNHPDANVQQLAFPSANVFNSATDDAATPQENNHESKQPL